MELGNYKKFTSCIVILFDIGVVVTKELINFQLADNIDKYQTDLFGLECPWRKKMHASHILA